MPNQLIDLCGAQWDTQSSQPSETTRTFPFLHLPEERIISARPSTLLSFCGFIAILCAAQALTSSLWLDALPEGKMLWCDQKSSVLHWGLLYAWALSGVAIAYFLFRRNRLVAYALTIISYTWFWITAFCVNQEFDNIKRDLILLLLLGGLMIWSFINYQARLSASAKLAISNDGAETPLETPNARLPRSPSDSENPYAPPPWTSNDGT